MRTKYRYPVHEMLQKSDKPCHCQRVADKEPICRNQVSRGRGKQTVPKPIRDKPDMAERVNFQITVFNQGAVRDFLITVLKNSAKLQTLPLLQKKTMLL